jgi:pSer/pThr/pTyr-binding forkhead associated (FHA) protein
MCALFLTDNGSRFGTIVNEHTVAANKPLALSDGDIIQFGKYHSRLRSVMQHLTLR